MRSDKDTKKIIKRVEQTFESLIVKVPHFEVLNKKYLPDGLKPHTRSICWLAEQVILQNTKKHKKKFGIIKFHYPPSDISAWDVKFSFKDLCAKEEIFINIKVTDITRPIRKNDIASVKKLLAFYSKYDNPLLLYAVFKIKFDNTIIRFKKHPIIRNYTWMDNKFVVNPRNEHVQSYYECSTVERTEKEFLKLLKKKAKEKGLKV